MAMTRVGRAARNIGVLLLMATLWLAFVLPGYSDRGMRERGVRIMIGCFVGSVLAFGVAIVKRR
jgi:putative effector of murein hydrolase